MKLKVLALCLLTVCILAGCGESEEVSVPADDQITGQVYKVDEVVEEKAVEPPKEEIKTIKFCADTDNGQNQWEAGLVRGFYDNAQSFEFVDECKDEGKFVVEYNCDDEENPKSEIFLCKSGCVDGACI